MAEIKKKTENEFFSLFLAENNSKNRNFNTVIKCAEATHM